MKLPSLFTSGRSPRTALGLSVDKQVVHVVVLQQREDAYVVVDCYSRRRGKDFSSAAAETDPTSGAFSDGPPTEASSDDYSINFDDSHGGEGQLPGGGGASGAGDLSFESVEAETGGPAQRNTDLAPLLREIMEAAESQYGGDLEVAFCVGAPEVSGVALSGVDVSDITRSRQDLIARLNADLDASCTDDQVAFLPTVGSESGDAGVLAVVREERDAVTGALSFLHDKSLRSLPLVRFMESELTLYTDLLGETIDFEDDERTLLLRVGGDDTLVMFMEGRRLRYQEYLRSITTLESADTVCSRVLLQQDEAGIDGVDRIVLIAEERQEEFAARLRDFYPDADVVAIGALMARKGIALGDVEASGMSNVTPWVAAIGVARRLLGETSKKALEHVNLLPRNLRRRKAAVQVAWHTIAMAVVLFLVGFFFSTRYYNYQEQVRELEQQIDQYPASLELTEDQLQGRIDSLQQVYDRYSRALVRLDTVLQGSDRWSRMLARTVEHAETTPGLWVEEWHPSERTVNLVGYATERNRVVQLSNNLNASIDQLTSSSIRDYPVHRFSITAPLPRGLPRSVRYLRQRELLSASDDQSSVPAP